MLSFSMIKTESRVLSFSMSVYTPRLMGQGHKTARFAVPEGRWRQSRTSLFADGPGLDLGQILEVQTGRTADLLLA